MSKTETAEQIRERIRAEIQRENLRNLMAALRSSVYISTDKHTGEAIAR